MKKQMLILAFLALNLIVFPGLSYAKKIQLTDFGQVFEALKSGKTVKVIFFYKRCKLISDNEVVEKVPDAIGGMELNTFEYFAPKSVGNSKGFISSSKTVLINHPRYGFVRNYAKSRIYDDNSIRIIAQYLTPDTYEIKMDESFYTVIDNGKNKGGAKFFTDQK